MYKNLYNASYNNTGSECGIVYGVGGRGIYNAWGVVGGLRYEHCKKMFKTITLCEKCFNTRISYPYSVGVSWGSPTPLIGDIIMFPTR